MGADAAFHIELPETAPAPEPLGVAKAVQAIIEKQLNSVDMVILGKQSIDDDLGQTGQMLAGLLDWGQATDLEQKNAVITREIDGGLEQVCVKFPLIVTTDLRLNEPRYASLPNIMKAKKKAVTKLTPAEVTEPPKRVGGTKVESVDELVEKLKAAGFTAVS
ncbi:electron transfer flavo protein beta subunit [Lentinula edodes]|uniref:Electron transfer flavo protein beta subunit n=1 Tax=Lentinula edodes TaxID=5353 RepID=A0A1Q3E7M6_LENED|nr:electron transfer flavo protein beta subunit [Lentinula edodes]